MKNLIFKIATCFCLILSPSAVAQTKRAMTYDDTMALKTVGSTAISPDGKQALYTLSYADMKANERRTEIWIVSTEKGDDGRPNAKPRRFTYGKKVTEIVKNDLVISDPQFSPDGKRLSFTAHPTPKADD